MSDATSDAIVRGTRQAALDFGINRLTIADVARRSGVSRQTIYHHYRNVESILDELLAREFAKVLERVAATVDGANGRSRVVARIAATVQALRGHPLLRKVLDAEPEVLLPYMFERLGTVQHRALQLITADLIDAQADGSVRGGDPHVISYSLLLVAQAFVLTRARARRVSSADLLDELRHVVDGALRPVGGV